VLFATSSFWQGVDVPGEQLSCVIIDKLPFAVPSDPVVEARIERPRRRREIRSTTTRFRRPLSR
jgi:Rad3-related DNA helicase